MNFNLLLSALRARYRLFLLILATTVAVTIIVSLVVPKSYIAKASLLVAGKDEQSMRTTYAPQESDRAGYVQTQVDILTSSKVAHRVVAALDMARDPRAREDFAAAGSTGLIEDWLAEGLRKDIKVETAQSNIYQQSSIVQLSFSSDNANFSAAVANAFAKAYVDTVLELRTEPTRQTSIWFDEQMKELRGNMEQAEKRLSDFQQEHRIAANDEHLDVESTQLASLAGQVATARGPAGEVRRFQGSGTAKESLPEILANSGIQALKGDLMRAEAKLQQMSTELGSQHPQYLRQLAEVQSLREKVGSEMENVIAGAEQSAQRSRQNKNRLVGEMETQRQRVLGLKQARNQLTILSHDVEIAQRTYETVMQRFLASKIESRAVQTNVTVLDQAGINEGQLGMGKGLLFRGCISGMAVSHF